RLPGHMVPSPGNILHLEALPLTPTGKVDRKALPAPQARPRGEDEDLAASRSDSERQIAAIWGKVLGFDNVGLHESFIDLGGHSLLGIQIVSQINEIYNIRLPLSLFLRGTTVANVAARVEELTGGAASPSPAGAEPAPAIPAARSPQATAAAEPEGQQGLQTLVLPNGRQIVCVQRPEAAYLYVDVFEHRTYDRAGIRYPESGCVLDVGANIGLFTLYALDRSPGLRVLAFEPAPPLFAALEKNLASLPNVALFPVGLSDRAGTGRLTYYPTLTGMTSLYPDPEQERALFGTILKNLAEQGHQGMTEVLPYAQELAEDRLRKTTFDCELQPLSAIIAAQGLAQIDLLKIDVQKAELDVLRGIADDDWGKIRQLAVEVHDLDHQVDRVADLLRAKGYRVSVEQDPLHQGTVVHFVYAT
nr:FkbM family methyltransferase [Acidobacteriota bacterium]